MASRADRLHAEVDRQLTEVRSQADSLATRSGLLLSALAVGAAILGARIQRDGASGFTLSLIVFGAAALVALIPLLPNLLTGPDPSDLVSWSGTGMTETVANSALFQAKVEALRANRRHLTTMSVGLYLQMATSVGAVILALAQTGS